METETGAEFISQAHVRHIMRYVSAAKFLDKNDIVLDAACGTGYGSKILADHCYSVIGVDFDGKAIEEALKYKSARCQFQQADLLTSSLGSMHKIVSIETIEHLTKENGMRLLNNFYKWLGRPGTLIISTPYCLQSGPSPITKQHLWEYSLTDFEQALSLSGFNVDHIEINRHEGKAGRLGYCLAKATKR